MRAELKSVAIQGELGSNSHMAARDLYPAATIVACERSAEVVARVTSGAVDAAVLPIENSLHGSVAEHYDLLLEEPIRIVGESLLRIRHNVIAMPGVRLEEIRRVLSHPVALSQCRRWFEAHPAIRAEPYYDTAGSVKVLMEQNARDAAGIAPALAAHVYGAEVLVEGVEDHARNYTRFLTVVRAESVAKLDWVSDGDVNKASLAFMLEHRPGTLVNALSRLAGAGADLTKIESRPVHGQPWEYIFYVDLRCTGSRGADAVIEALKPACGMLRELGRYGSAPGGASEGGADFDEKRLV